MLDILFIIQSDSMPSSRIRVRDLAPVLRKNGINPRIEVLPKSTGERRQLYRKSANYPVVVLQKKLLKWLDFSELRRQAGFLIFDFDDAIYYRCASPSENPKDYESSTRRRTFQRIAREADVLIAANQVLARRAQELAPNATIHILPSSISIRDIAVKTDYSLPKQPVIGWIGSSSTLRYLDMVTEALKRLQAEYNTILHVIADKPFEAEGVSSHFTAWRLEEQYHLISNFDVGIMPLSADLFSEGKASFKLLQYMSCAVPAVCSPVGMNVDVADSDKNCLLAENTDEFYAKIKQLLEDQDLRQQLGQSGRQLIESTYTTEVVGKRLAEILQDAAGHKRVGHFYRMWSDRKKQLLSGEVTRRPTGNWQVANGFTVETGIEVVKQHNAICETEPESLLKAGRKRRVSRVGASNKIYLVKEFRSPGPWGRFAADARSWVCNHGLQGCGIRIPKPYAWFRSKSGEAYLISEFIDGEGLYQYLSQAPSNFDEVAAKVHDLVKQLYHWRIVHEDLKLGNLILRDGEIYVVDNDAVLFNQRIQEKHWQRNLRHLTSGQGEVWDRLRDYLTSQDKPYQ